MPYTQMATALGLAGLDWPRVTAVRVLRADDAMRRGTYEKTNPAHHGWRERTIVVLDAPHPEIYAYPPSVVMTQEAVRDDENAMTFAIRHINDVVYAREAGLVSRCFFERNGRPAGEVVCEWLDGGGVRLQMVATFVETRVVRQRMMTTVKTICAVEDAGALRPVFDALVSPGRSRRPARTPDPEECTVRLGPAGT